MSQEPTVVPAARRLRRLRWQMTLAFAAANLVGLVVLDGVALKVDGASAYRSEYQEALRRLNTAESLIYTDMGRASLRSLKREAVASGHPEVYVLAGDDLSVIYASRGRKYSLNDDQLRTAARQATGAAGPVRANAQDVSGHNVYLLSQRYFDDVQPDRVAGVIVTVGDPAAGHDEHERLRWALLFGTAALVLLSSAVGHALAGRAVRPAVASLSQQERFLADASHEMRTPVAALRAAAEAALAESAASPSAAGMPDAALSRARLEGVVRDAHRLSSLVEALLTRARLKAGVQAAQRERLRLDLLVEDIIADMVEGGLVDGDVTFHPTPIVTEADPTLLRLAVRNLIDNAIRHGHRRGERPEVRVSVGPKSIVVADNGPGVSQEMLRSGFVRYATGSQVGTGLGLSIVAEVAAAHGGRLNVRNATDVGAVFTLELS